MLTLNEVLSGKAWRTLPLPAEDQLTHRSIQACAHTRARAALNPCSQPKKQTDTQYGNRLENKIIFPVLQSWTHWLNRLLYYYFFIIVKVLIRTHPIGSSSFIFLDRLGLRRLNWLWTRCRHFVTDATLHNVSQHFISSVRLYWGI